MGNIFLGLTGNIGSGKTTVLNLFYEKGFRTLNADKMVHSMFVAAHPFYVELARQIDDYFKTSFLKTNTIDRNILRNLIKGEVNSLTVLADIVKPFISEEILKEKCIEQNTIIEVPLLFEASNKEFYDKVVLVYSDDDERKRRIKIRNPDWKEEHIQTVMSSQMSQQEKLKMADYVIFNQKHADLHEQIDKIIWSLKHSKKINSFYQNK